MCRMYLLFKAEDPPQKAAFVLAIRHIDVRHVRIKARFIF